MKKLLRQFIPPVLMPLFKRLVRRSGYFGSYASWSEAQRASSGYDADLILERVKDSLLKVKNGEAVYERDSVLFDEIQYAWPLLAALLWVASRSGNRLSVLDFGGSLGSSYFQNRAFLDHLAIFEWSIVEQERFIACGKAHFEDAHLRFYYSIEECLKERTPDLILLSSVVPYLEQPYALLDTVIAQGAPYLVVDRTPLLDSGADRITVQKVPPVVYPASYPAWILNRDNFLNRFSGAYRLVAEFAGLSGEIELGDTRARDRGFIFQHCGGSR